MEKLDALKISKFKSSHPKRYQQDLIQTSALLPPIHVNTIDKPVSRNAYLRDKVNQTHDASSLRSRASSLPPSFVSDNWSQLDRIREQAVT